MLTARQRRGRGQDAGAISTVAQFLMRGLGTAFGAFVVGVPRSDPRRSVVPLLHFGGGSLDRRRRPGRCLGLCLAA